MAKLNEKDWSINAYAALMTVQGFGNLSKNEQAEIGILIENAPESISRPGAAKLVAAIASLLLKRES